MNIETTRFSQAQVLVAALFAVVFTGTMPEGIVPIDGKVQALDDEFHDVFKDKRHISARLANACITWVPDLPQFADDRINVSRLIRQMRMMPSSVAYLVGEELESRGLGRPSTFSHRYGKFRGIVAKVSREYGVDQRIIMLCWERPEDLDAAWHNCRNEYLKIRAERAGVKA